MSTKTYSKVYKHTVGGLSRLFRFNYQSKTLECVEFPDVETLRDLKDAARNAQNSIEKDEANRNLKSYHETGYIPTNTMNGLTKDDWKNRKDFWIDEMARRIG